MGRVKPFLINFTPLLDVAAVATAVADVAAGHPLPPPVAVGGVTVFQLQHNYDHLPFERNLPESRYPDAVVGVVVVD